MTGEIATGATKAGDEAGKRISASMGQHIGKATASLGKGIATALGSGVIALSAFGVQSIKTSGRRRENAGDARRARQGERAVGQRR